MNTDWHKNTPKHIWNAGGDRKTFTVEVVCWARSDGSYTWNIYAYVFDTHRHFDKPTFIAEHAPFHAGCTFDELQTTEPARGIKYDWQKKHVFYKFGSDYAHYMDDYYMQCGPDDMPGQVIADANALVIWLKGGDE